jgi:PAS domain S-box-containing protein
MHDGDKTKEQMVNEMLQLRQQVAALEAAEAEHKRAEEDLKEHEENFKTLAENAADGIAIVTPEGTHVYVNKKAAAIAGYSVDELLHVNVKELLPSDEYRKLMKLFKKRLAGESQPSKYETTFIRKDGTQIPLEISVALTTWHGKPADIVFSRDITERKRAEEDLLESEEKYRELVERANDGITIIQDGIMRYINPRLAEIWGGTAQELRDTPFTDYIDPDELPIVVDRYNRRMKGEDVPSIYETVLRRKDGSKVYAELNAGSITYQGKFAHLVLVRNITERKQAEKELKESEERYRLLSL